MKYRPVLAFSAVLLALAPASAMAAPNLSGVTAAPVSPLAGAHSDFTTEFSVNDLGAVGAGGDDVSGFQLDLPVGMVGDPFAAPTCNAAQLAAAACPADSQVGETTTTADVELGAMSLPNSEIHGEIYNMEVTGTESARLGTVLHPTLPIPVPLSPVEFESVIRVRTVTAANGMAAGGLTAVTAGLPTTQPTPFGTAQIRVSKISLTLYGVVGTNPYLTNPTLCVVPAATRVTVTTTAGENPTAITAYQPTDCAGVPFSPTLEMISSSTTNDAVTSVTTNVKLPAYTDPATRAGAQPRVAAVVLPKGFELSPTIGTTGLVGCSDEQLHKESATPDTCPADSQIGTVTFVSPLTAAPLQGKVYISASTSPAFLNRIFIVAQESAAVDALRIKLVGNVNPDASTGQVTTSLEGLPPLPFTDFSLTFRGGDNAVFTTPRECGTYTSAAQFAPFSAPATPTTVTASTVINSDCVNVNQFTPSVSVTPSSSAAGQSVDVTTTVARPDRHARLKDVTLHLPAGLTGKLTGKTMCSTDLAALDSCPSDSQVGTVTVLSGAGATPLSSEGKVYLTPKQSDNSLAGLAIVVPAVVGPLDLGKSVTYADISTRSDASLDITVKDIVSRLRGVALNIRSMSIKLDKPDFMRNATSCVGLATTGTLVSDLGVSVDASSPYQATDCNLLPYTPTVSAKLGANVNEVKAKAHPSLTVNVNQSGLQANSKKVTVTLPAGVASNLEAINQACPVATYNAGGDCGTKAVVGSATAVSPLLPDPLSGPVTIVSVPGQSLPDLRVQLNGAIKLSLTGKVTIAKTGQLVNTFDNLPDVALSSFSLTVNAPSGDYKGLLSLANELCGPLKLDAQMIAHSGATLSTTGDAALPVGACGTFAKTPSVSVKVSRLSKKPQMRVKVSGTNISAFSVLLPKGVNYAKGKKINVRVGGVSGKAKVKVTSKRMLVTLPKGATSANVLVTDKALKVTKGKSKSKAKVSVKVNVASAAPKTSKTYKVKQTKTVK